MARIFHALTAEELASLRVEFALLNLPVQLDMDGDTAVLHMPNTLAVHAEVKALFLVERKTDGFRCDITACDC